MKPMRLGTLTIYPIIQPVEEQFSSLKTINFYLVQSETSLTLIDAGMNSDNYWEHFLQSLHSYGFQLNDITAIYLTHHHIDHVGLVNRIIAQHPIPVFAHEQAIPRLKRNPDFLAQQIDFYTNLYEEMGCGEFGKQQMAEIKKSIMKNEHLAIDSDITRFEKDDDLFTIIETPGHAPDQVAFFAPDSRCLIAGDLLIEHISSNALVIPDENGVRRHTLVEHIASHQKCLPLEVDYVFSGHGSLIENPVKLIENRLEGIEKKAAKILSYVRDGFTTANEIAKQFYKSIYFSQFRLVMSEVIGQLDYLEVQKKLTKEKKNGIWHYRPCERSFS